MWSGGQSSEAELTVLAFRPRPDGSLQVLWGRSDERMPDGSLAVIVPSERLRPPEDAAAAKARAALLTPLTLPADVVVTPVLFGIYLLNSGG